MNNEIEKDYARLVAAQNESKRMLKIKSINNTLSEEYKKKSTFAIVSGVCFAGVMVATHFSGFDVNQAIQTEIQALSSFDALKEYLTMFTPAMWEQWLQLWEVYLNILSTEKIIIKLTKSFLI